MNKCIICNQEIKEALKIIREPITVHQENYKYFDEENYYKLLSVYENCQWFINNWEQLEINFKDLQKQLEAYENMRKEVIELIENVDVSITEYLHGFGYENRKKDLLNILNKVGKND